MTILHSSCSCSSVACTALDNSTGDGAYTQRHEMRPAYARSKRRAFRLASSMHTTNGVTPAEAMPASRASAAALLPGIPSKATALIPPVASDLLECAEKLVSAHFGQPIRQKVPMVQFDSVQAPREQLLWLPGVPTVPTVGVAIVESAP